MRSTVRTRMERLEGRLIEAESDGKLPLALIRRSAAGSLTREEFVRWRTVIEQIIAAANSGEDQTNG